VEALLHQFADLERVIEGGAPKLGAVKAAVQALIAQHSNYQSVTRHDRRDRTQEGALAATHETLQTSLANLLPSLTVPLSSATHPANAADGADVTGSPSTDGQ
jgi:hypothetical protein